MVPQVGGVREDVEISLDMMFKTVSWVGPSNHVLHGVQIPHGRGQFFGRIGTAKCNIEGECSSGNMASSHITLEIGISHM